MHGLEFLVVEVSAGCEWLCVVGGECEGVVWWECVVDGVSAPCAWELFVAEVLGFASVGSVSSSVAFGCHRCHRLCCCYPRQLSMVLTRAALLDRIPVAAPGPLVGLCVGADAVIRTRNLPLTRRLLCRLSYKGGWAVERTQAKSLYRSQLQPSLGFPAAHVFILASPAWITFTVALS